MEEHDSFENRELVLDFYFQLMDFLAVYEDLGDDYRIYSECLPDGRFLVKLFCMNPARHLKECLDKGRATVFFSATLLPVTYYKELLSGNQEDYAVYVESPFPRENRLLLVASEPLYQEKPERIREGGRVHSDGGTRAKGQLSGVFPVISIPESCGGDLGSTDGGRTGKWKAAARRRCHSLAEPGWAYERRGERGIFTGI